MLRVAGKSMRDAYQAAYQSTGNDMTMRSNGAKVERRPHVKRFIEQIKTETSTALVKQVSGDLALDRRYVLENLKEIVERCMTRAPVLDRSGKPVTVETKQGTLAAAFMFDAKGANTALQLIGKELGMFVERKEVRHGPLAQASDEELDAELTQIARDLADITGKPLKRILMESVRAELAIDVTPTEHANAAAGDDDATDGTPGGESERADVGLQ